MPQYHQPRRTLRRAANGHFLLTRPRGQDFLLGVRATLFMVENRALAGKFIATKNRADKPDGPETMHQFDVITLRALAVRCA